MPRCFASPWMLVRATTIPAVPILAMEWAEF